MAFKRVTKPNKTPPAFLSISVKQGIPTSFALSQRAHERIGSPRALQVEWDDTDGLIRIVAANPEDPDSFRVPYGSSRAIAARQLLRTLGVSPTESVQVPTIPDGPTAVIADLSEYVNA